MAVHLSFLPGPPWPAPTDHPLFKRRGLRTLGASVAGVDVARRATTSPPRSAAVAWGVLLGRNVRSQAFRLLPVSSTCVVALAVAGVALAQSRTTVTAVANIKGAGGTSASAPFTLVVDQFATDAERDALMAAVKKGGTAAARDLLAKRADAGSVELGGQRTAVKYMSTRGLPARVVSSPRLPQSRSWLWAQASPTPRQTPISGSCCST